MAKIMVFQHVPYEPLGTLDPLIREHRHRIRYVNFGREPNAHPSLEGYDALIVLGGPMNIGEESDYPHLAVEKKIIRQAIDSDMPVLGICLGAQLIAASLGAAVYPANSNEIGWIELQPTDLGSEDPVTTAFREQESIFQWHSYTFDLPENSKLLVKGKDIKNQAFKYKDKVYGFQFHLEANLPLIKRWLHLPQHLQELGLENAEQRVEKIWGETQSLIGSSLSLSKKVFTQFLSLIPKVNTVHHLPHRH